MTKYCYAEQAGAAAVIIYNITKGPLSEIWNKPTRFRS